MHVSLLELNALTRALQECIAPSILSVSERQRLEGWSYVNSVLTEKLESDKSVVRKIRFFLTLIQMTSLCFYFRRFHKTGRVNQIRILRLFCDSPIPLLRKGFWGLSTLLKLSVYAHPRVQRQIEYYPNLATRISIHAD